MKIVTIFAGQLYAFHYKDYLDNEYDRLMENWTNVNYLKDYAIKNNIKNIDGFINEILKDAEQIQDYLEDINQNKDSYGFYFEPLKTIYINKSLALQKGKIYKNSLRYYAIKIDENCYVITGGAIKMSQKMQGHPDTILELHKLLKARAYFEQNEIANEESFYELLIEQL